MSIERKVSINTAIHDALRRDMARVLAIDVRPDRTRASAVAEHLSWMMQRLHHHHEGEDAGLWPALMLHSPDSVDLVRQMADEHRDLAAAVRAVENSCLALGRAADEPAVDLHTPFAALQSAVALLQSVAVPHLEHEEAEAMPIVVRDLPEEAFDEVEKRYFREKVGLADLGRWMLWLSDEPRPDLERVFTENLPKPLVLLATWRARKKYLIQARIMWGYEPKIVI